MNIHFLYKKYKIFSSYKVMSSLENNRREMFDFFFFNFCVY